MLARVLLGILIRILWAGRPYLREEEDDTQVGAEGRVEKKGKRFCPFRILCKEYDLGNFTRIKWELANHFDTFKKWLHNYPRLILFNSRFEEKPF